MPDLQALLDQIQERAKTAGHHVAKLCTKEDRWKMSVPVQDDDSDVLLTQITDRDVPQLAKALQAVLAKCASMERGVGYRVSGQHDTWDSYHEGMSDMAGHIEEAITDALGVDDAS